MSEKGGYKIINFSGMLKKVGVAESVNIPGIYEAIEDNYGKALLLAGLAVEVSEGSVVEYNDVFANPIISSTSFVFNIPEYSLTITVESDDDVVVNSLSPTATATVAGSVKQAANVPASTASSSPTTAEFNALLTALKNAGIMVADAE